MKNKDILIIGFSTLAAIGLTIFLAGKKRKNIIIEQLERIADEGYETAGDILFPQRKRGKRNKNYSYSNYEG